MEESKRKMRERERERERKERQRKTEEAFVGNISFFLDASLAPLPSSGKVEERKEEKALYSLSERKKTKGVSRENRDVSPNDFLSSFSRSRSSVLAPIGQRRKNRKSEDGRG